MRQQFIELLFLRLFGLGLGLALGEFFDALGSGGQAQCFQAFSLFGGLACRPLQALLRTVFVVVQPVPPIGLFPAPLRALGQLPQAVFQCGAGQGIYAYVTLMAGEEGTDELKTELVKLVRGEIGPIAKINLIQWAPGLPKTRSGKIMRRILRKIAANEIDALGDTSTLADPSVVDDLIDNRENR